MIRKDGENEGELMMKKVPCGLIMVLSVMLFVQVSSAAGRTPSAGEQFPDITLAAPETSPQKEYLGLNGKGSFRLSQIRAELLIIEIFSMYCPYCQREAPNVNELYRIISAREDIKDKIKIIAIGAGNTPLEVDVFRKKYSIEFPLFSDESFSVHTATGGVRTPYFFVIRTKAGEPGIIVYSKVGSIEDPQQFLDLIIKKQP
jgi:peroxiredoxin